MFLVSRYPPALKFIDTYSAQKSPARDEFEFHRVAGGLHKSVLGPRNPHWFIFFGSSCSEYPLVIERSELEHQGF